MSKNNIWYLAGPFHQYQEDVKALAKEAGLTIIDANAAEGRKGAAKDVPEVTIRPELQAVVLVAVGLGNESIEYLRAQLGAVEVLSASLESGSLDIPSGEGVSLRIHQAVTQLHKDLEGEVAERTFIGAIVESFAAQALERPEGSLGETASRLFEVLEAVNAGVAGLQRERDGLAGDADRLKQEGDELRQQIEALKAAATDPEAEAMKAKLDAAGVTYRANASKENLQKLVAELPQA